MLYHRMSLSTASSTSRYLQITVHVMVIDSIIKSSRFDPQESL
jgi:hypothetical protein